VSLAGSVPKQGPETRQRSSAGGPKFKGVIAALWYSSNSSGDESLDNGCCSNVPFDVQGDKDVSVVRRC